MMELGKEFIWCDEACVYEIVSPDRQTKGYYLKRAFTRGLAQAWEHPFLSLSTARSLVAVLVYTMSLPFCLLLGSHVFMNYLVRDCDHLGKLLAYAGICVTSQRPY
jgi:hypothetical protein